MKKIPRGVYRSIPYVGAILGLTGMVLKLKNDKMKSLVCSPMMDDGLVTPEKANSKSK